MIHWFCHLLLAVSLGLSAWRLFRGPTAADRILAIDLMAVITASAILIHAMSNGGRVFVDVVMVLGIIVFFGTVALAKTLFKEP